MEQIWFIGGRKIKYRKSFKYLTLILWACECQRKDITYRGKYARIEYQMQRFIPRFKWPTGECLAPHSVRIKSAPLSVTSKREHSVQFQGKGGSEAGTAKCVQMYSSAIVVHWMLALQRALKASSCFIPRSLLPVRSLGDIFPVHSPVHTLTTRIHI